MFDELLKHISRNDEDKVEPEFNPSEENES